MAKTEGIIRNAESMNGSKDEIETAALAAEKIQS